MRPKKTLWSDLVPPMDDAEARAMLDTMVDARRAKAQAYLPGLRDFPAGRAEGCLVYDEYGGAYLDFGPGGAVNILGHGHPHIKHVISEHLHFYAYTGDDHLNRYVLEYAEALSAKFPADDGTSRQVLVLPGVRDARWIAHQMPGHCADETTTGFGRTGVLWDHLRQGAVACPDIVVLGEAGGGGLPFAAIVAAPRFFEGVIADIPAMAAHPVVCSVALVVLEYLTEDLLAHVSAMGQLLAEGVSELATQFPDTITGSLGTGLLHKLDLNYTIPRDKFIRSCRDKGLLLHSDLQMTPPLVITEQELKQAIDVLGDVCLDWS